MNFTREPIIETVITPREGCKLVVRNSKGNDQEDYFVDAVEVVSFGHSFFFRSLERPKSFLVPVSDYEIIELKETRMVLKNVSTDRSIKIGGGREAPPPRHQSSREESHGEDSRSGEESRPPMDRKRDKRRRGRRGRDRVPQEMRERESVPPIEGTPMPPDLPSEAAPAFVEGSVAEERTPSIISKLFPPPPTLIKETLSRYKPAESSDEEPKYSEEIEEKTSFEESIFEHTEEDFPRKSEEEDNRFEE